MTLSSTSDGVERILCGLIGRGIRASRTPRMHEREAAAQRLHLLYALFDFAELGLDETDLPRMLAAAELTGFSGVNVTHPYKQAIIPHLHELSREAQEIGAVNTVVFQAGRRIGHNTDVYGFARAFERALPGAPVACIVQMGAGGGGAATAYALLRLGCERLVIHDRDRAKAEALVASLGACHDPARLRVGADLAADVAVADGIVNATPMGMPSHPGLAVPPALLRGDLWVADIVYVPLETAFLAAARQLGCRSMDGSGMAVHQAVAAYEIFTGRAADAIRMSRTFREFA